MQENKLIIQNATGTVGSGYTYGGEKLSSFGTVEIHFNSDEDTTRALGVYSARYDLPDTNVIVYVDGKGENNDALHLTNWAPHFVAGSYTAIVNSPSADALNISHDAQRAAEGQSYATIGNLKATVSNGNGIRANSSIHSSEDTSTITVTGTTDITINGGPITISKMEHKEFGDKFVGAEVDANASTTYNPAAVYAGDDMYNAQIMGYGMGGQSQGKGIIDLQGDTTLQLNGNGNYGVYAGKNGSIGVNNINIVSEGNNSYGIAAKIQTLFMAMVFNLQILPLQHIF